MILPARCLMPKKKKNRYKTTYIEGLRACFVTSTEMTSNTGEANFERIPGGMDQTLILIEDLSRTIEYMYKGTATATWYTNESNASIWEIRGHKKELVVMLHYENGCKESNEIVDSEDTIFIKEEPRDVVNVRHQNESAQDIECTDDAKVVVHMSDTDNPTCQPTNDYSLRSTTCTLSEEAVSVQSSTFIDVSNEEAVSHLYTYIKCNVDTDLVADMNCIPVVPDSTSHLIKVYTSQSNACNGASTEEAIPRLDMVCSSTENVRGELGYYEDFKSEIIDAKINYGHRWHSNCETVPENNNNLCTIPQIEFVCKSNDTDTSQTQNENILVEMQSVKLKNCFVLLKPLEKDKLKINNLSSVQERVMPHECSVCNRKFNFRAHLIQHEVIHTGVKIHECSQCNKKFNRKGTLQRHMVIHSMVKPHECSHCNKKFNWQDQLKRHEATHTGVKPHKCSQCNQKFNHKVILKQHMIIHSELKPFECSRCNKKFDQYHQLRRHKLTHFAVYRKKHCK